MKNLTPFTERICFVVWQLFGVGVVVVGSLITLIVVQDITSSGPDYRRWSELLYCLPVVVVGVLILWFEPFKPKSK